MLDPGRCHEPSWLYERADQRAVAHALRQRTRLALRAAEASWLHRRLLAFGHAANDRGDHLIANAFFESAFNVHDDASAFISATNMRLKLGQFTFAAAVYERLLADLEEWSLTSTQIDLVQRKLGEARDAQARRAANDLRMRRLSDEVCELLRDRRVGSEIHADAERAARLARRLGHAANAAGDTEAAQCFFDCAFAMGCAPADLLSAANMRAKLAPGSAAAQAIYTHLLCLSEAGEHERHLAETKLAALRERTEAIVVDSPTSDG